MAIRYKTYKKRNWINDKELNYATPINRGVMKTKDVAELLERRTAFSQSDIIGVADALGRAILEFNALGFAVKIKGLGTFSISATSEGYETPEECLPERVKATKIRFIVDPELKKQLAKVTFERMVDQKSE